MRHIGTITYYNSKGKFGRVEENGISYYIARPTTQYLADPDTMLKRGNTIFFSVNPNKRPGQQDYAVNITRIVESYSPRVQRTPGEQYLMNIFRSSKWLLGWTILEQPCINHLKPDYVLIHPRKGVVIIEVKDWDLNNPRYCGSGKFLGNDNKLHEADPVTQLNRYASCFTQLSFLEPEGLQEHIWDTAQRLSNMSSNSDTTTIQTRNYPIFSQVVFFSHPNVTWEQATAFAPQAQFVWTRKEAEYLLADKAVFRDLDTKYPWPLRLFGYSEQAATKYYSESPKLPDGTNLFGEYLHRLICWLDGTDYEKSRMAPYQLTPAQQELAKDAPGACRVCDGVVGSGKSLILAEKAAHAIKAHRDALILTYNITLSNYLRDLCRQQFQGDSRAFNSCLWINYFHAVLQGVLAECGLFLKSEHINKKQVSSQAFSQYMSEYTHQAIDLIQRSPHRPFPTCFDDILIDEGNDFCDYEIEFLKDTLYTGKGEFLVMNDPSQRIYSSLNRSGSWSDDPESLGLTKVTLPYAYGIPESIRILLNKVHETFHLPGLIIQPDPDAQNDSSYGSIRWMNCDPAQLEQRILSELSYWLTEKNLHPEDLLLVTVDHHSAQRLSETLSHAGLPVQLCEDSRSSKLHFQAGKNTLKIATYHHLKGWYAPYVILILDTDLAPDETLEDSSALSAFYVSLSRVKPTKDTHAYCFRCLNFLPKEQIEPLEELCR